MTYLSLIVMTGDTTSGGPIPLSLTMVHFLILVAVRSYNIARGLGLA